MRHHVVASAKRIAGRCGSALHRVGGHRGAPGFGILLYHRVAKATPGAPAPSWNVTPDRFRAQIEGLLAAGYRIWPLRRMIDCVESGRAVPEKVTAITFDDGYQNNYLHAWPVLDELSVPATIFVATAYVGSTAPFPFDEWGGHWHGEAPAESWRPLKWGECRAMEASGVVEIGSHTHTHRDLRGDPATLRADVERSVVEIDDHLGPRAPLFAFPYGAPEAGFATAEDRHAAQAAGVRCALTTAGMLVRRGASPFEWGRFEVTGADNAATLEAKLAGWYDWVSSAKRWFVRVSPPPYLGPPQEPRSQPRSHPEASGPRRSERRVTRAASRRDRVLVLDAESTKALAVARALGPTMEVRTASRRRPAIAAWSRFTVEHHVCDVARDGDLADWVRDFCRARDIGVVLSPEETSSWLLARDRDSLAAAGITVPLPEQRVLEVAMDKARTLEAAREHSVPAPPTIVLDDVEQAVPAARELGWPVVVKPRWSHYWTGERFIVGGGVSYAACEDDLRAALARQPRGAPPPILQRYVPGRGLGLFFVLAPDGTLAAEFAHERLRDLRPTGSGSVLRRSVAVDPRLREIALRLLRGIGWWGVAMVEFRGEPADAMLMEINGRFWGSLQLAIDAGVNFPRILVDTAQGRTAPMPRYREGVVLRWWLGDLARVGRVMKGPPRGFAGAFPSRLEGLAQFLGPQPPRTRNEVLRWEDPLPAIGEVLSLLRR